MNRGQSASPHDGFASRMPGRPACCGPAASQGAGQCVEARTSDTRSYDMVYNNCHTRISPPCFPGRRLERRTPRPALCRRFLSPVNNGLGYSDYCRETYQYSGLHEPAIMKRHRREARRQIASLAAFPRSSTPSARSETTRLIHHASLPKCSRKRHDFFVNRQEQSKPLPVQGAYHDDWA